MLTVLRVFEGLGFFEEPAPFGGLFFFLDAGDQPIGACGVAGFGGDELVEQVGEVGVDLSLAFGEEFLGGSA